MPVAAPAPQPSAPPYTSWTPEQRAFDRRKKHANIAGMTDRILKRLGYPRKRHNFITAVQSAHGAGNDAKVPYTEFHRSNACLAEFLELNGKDQRSDEVMVSQMIKRHKDWQNQNGITLIEIIPPKQKYDTNTYIDYLTPAADEAMQRALNSPLWKTGKSNDKAAAIEEAVTWAVEKKLQHFTPQAEDDDDEDRSLILTDYLHQQMQQISRTAEKVALKAESKYHAPGEARVFLKKLALEINGIAESLERTWPARYAMIDEEALFSDSDQDSATTLPEPEKEIRYLSQDLGINSDKANENSDLIFQNQEVRLGPAIWRAGDSDIDFNVTVTADLGIGVDGQRYVSVAESSSGIPFDQLIYEEVAPIEAEAATAPVTAAEPVTEITEQESPPDMGQAALAYASWSIPVVPLHTPDPKGKCSCRDGVKCKSPGKHPRTKNGLKDATADLTKVKEWWEMWPEANIGIPTGKASGLLVIDSDPRHGGDASLTALIEEVWGDDMPNTQEVATGGGGHHLIFEYPAEVEIKNSSGKLGEGLDVRGEGGYIVAAPSLHASGRRYRRLNNVEPAELPSLLIEKLTKQPERNGSATARSYSAEIDTDGPPISEGGRNDKLFRICCALRSAGHEHREIEAAALEINAKRCQPPMSDDEVRAVVASSVRYPRGERIINEETKA